LLQGITCLTTERAVVLSAKKEMKRSEKCGAKELEDTAKEKDFWTNIFGGGVFASSGLAVAMITAATGQVWCLSVFAATIGITTFAIGKAVIANEEYKILAKTIDDGDYWCNEKKPQRPGTKKAVRMIYENTKQKMQERFRL